MYSPNRNPTELYYENHNERDALLRQEARNKCLERRPLATLSTMLVVIVVFVGFASIVVGPGRAVDYIGTYLLSGVWIIGVYEPRKKRSGAKQMLDPYEAIRQRREEMAHEARQNRLAGELRRSRRRPAGDRDWASELAWESRSIAGCLIKLVNSKDAGQGRGWRSWSAS